MPGSNLRHGPPGLHRRAIVLRVSPASRSVVLLTTSDTAAVVTVAGSIGAGESAAVDVLITRQDAVR